MDSKRPELALIEHALAAIAQTLVYVDDGREIPFYPPSDLAQLSPDDREAAQRTEQQQYRAKPEDTAVHFCLTAAIALLDVSQALLTRTAHASPQERAREWDDLIAYTKTAGRAAYRAALVLTDTKGA